MNYILVVIHDYFMTVAVEDFMDWFILSMSMPSVTTNCSK